MLEREFDIIKRAKGGDKEAFAQLYEHYHPPIYRFVVLKVSMRQEAEDLTHEVFLSAWQKLPRFKHRGLPFSSWLYRIARNRVIDFYRTQKKHLNLEDAAGHPQFIDEPTQGILADVNIDMRRVQSAMESLTADQQDVLILRFIEEYSTKEIAQMMKKQEGTVRILQHRALKAIEKYL
ncbi:MAG: RNA polymerase sigma factor [Candidatus Harrisonbacteria bacterium]|nr:RNA polymerase sigma factor [Candidatus Harrisonbacteria bacterium]